MIFAPNHHSHLDTALMVRSVPAAWRAHLVTAAAADYFFDKRWKATLAALALNAIPVDREVTGRKSADLMAGLIEDGWSLVIYPEGGRSPDGWGQTFRGGASYLAGRTGAPVVPVYIDGTDSIMGKGTSGAQARADPGDVRQPAAPRARGVDAPLQRAHRAGRRRARRRVDDRLLVGATPGGRRCDPVADRARLHRMAATLGRHRPPPPRHRRLAQPAQRRWPQL